MLWKVQDKETRKTTETKLPGEEVMEEQLKSGSRRSLKF